MRYYYTQTLGWLKSEVDRRKSHAWQYHQNHDWNSLFPCKYSVIILYFIYYFNYIFWVLVGQTQWWISAVFTLFFWIKREWTYQMCHKEKKSLNPKCAWDEYVWWGGNDKKIYTIIAINKVVEYIWFKICIIFRILHFQFSILLFFLKSQHMR